MTSTDNLAQVYMSLGFDPIPAQRYADAGLEPPEIEEWLNTGVPSKDRKTICPKKSQESDTLEF